MLLVQKKLGAVQNLGWLDRSLRVIIGFALIGVAYFYFKDGVTVGWYAYLSIISLYPLLTGILGWDPLYAVVHVKSCDTSSRNQCGTFPYEIESAVGKNVHCADGYDCSVPGDLHDKASHAK